jgi:hypothetical protein
MYHHIHQLAQSSGHQHSGVVFLQSLYTLSDVNIFFSYQSCYRMLLAQLLVCFLNDFRQVKRFKES